MLIVAGASCATNAASASLINAKGQLQLIAESQSSQEVGEGESAWLKCLSAAADSSSAPCPPQSYQLPDDDTNTRSPTDQQGGNASLPAVHQTGSLVFGEIPCQHLTDQTFLPPFPRPIEELLKIPIA